MSTRLWRIARLVATVVELAVLNTPPKSTAGTRR
jgi:hypothetical protein